MTHLSLFSGIGGLDLAAHWAGFETVQFVEIDPFCQKVLAKNFPGIPIHGDIKTFDGKPFRGRTTLLSGGFPCQPFSHAGKRRGKEDDRFLWPEMLRVIAEVRPAYIVGENVAGFVNMALDDCLTGLEAQGYEALAFVLPACAVGAPHRRDRCFIVACDTYRDCKPDGTKYAKAQVMQGDADVADAPGWQRHGCGPSRAERWSEPTNCCGDVFDADDWCGTMRGNWQLSAVATAKRIGTDHRRRAAQHEPGQWWEVEPGMGRVVDGLPNRAHRLRSLGNAVVPRQVFPILKAIADDIQGRVVA